MPEHINTHLAIALILGAFVLGYLLAEWYFDGILRKTEVKLAECADAVEDLVSKNDRADKLNENQRRQIVELESLLQLVPEET